MNSCSGRRLAAARPLTTPRPATNVAAMRRVGPVGRRWAESGLHDEYPYPDARTQDLRGVRADRRPAGRDRAARALPLGGRALPDAARRDGHREDGDDGLDHRADPAAGADHRAQQDARRAALQRVPRVLPAERGRVLRLVLRLLPARGVRPAGRPLHREGQLAQRRHRPAPPRGDVEPALAPRRDHRRVGLVHLRPRLAGGVREARRLPDGRRGDGSRRDAAQADRHPVRAQRHAARPRPLPREGRRDRDPAGVRGDGLPRLDVRRRGRADHALRPAHRRGVREARHDHGLPGDAVRHLEADDRARPGRDQARAGSSRSRSSSRRAACSRRTGSASAPSTTWR